MSGEMRKVPKRRFKEFENAGPWEQRKLGEVATMHARIGWQNLRTSEFLDIGDYMLITGTDFEDGAINYSTCHYVEKARYDQDTHIQIDNGSILITKDGTLGKVAYIQGLSMPATLNAGVFNVEIKDEKSVDSKYLFQYLKAPFLMDYVDKKATGGTIKHLNQNILVDFPIVLPKIAEQVRIGAYFSSLDHLITLHQRKLDKMKVLKKSYLSEMFPTEGERKPKRRFPGFTDDWEQRKVGELTHVASAARVHKEEWAAQGVPFFRSSDVVSAYKGNENARVYISWELYGQLSSISGKLEKNDILITGGGSVGIPYIVPNNDPLYSKDADLIWIKHSKNFDSQYMFTYMTSQSFRTYLNAISHIGTIAHYTIEQVKDTPIRLPSIAEQEAIGQYFCDLDHLITLHQRKLDKLKSIKKAYLNEMFV